MKYLYKIYFITLFEKKEKFKVKKNLDQKNQNYHIKKKEN